MTSLERRKIQAELKENKFFGENSHIIWWRIHYDRFNEIDRLEPIIDE